MLTGLRFKGSFFIPALALCLCGLPAMAGTLFTDLGPSGNVYQAGAGWTVSGSGSVGINIVANLFTVGGTGSDLVTEIDLGVGYVNAPDSFDASIWTDVGGVPGAQVSNAVWNNLSANTYFGDCCDLVSITGITGVTLTGGDSYFMVLGPVSLSDSSFNAWNWNSQSATGTVLGSSNGGTSWEQALPSTLSAFDVLGGSSTPEPGSLLLLGTGLMAMLAAFRRKSTR